MDEFSVSVLVDVFGLGVKVWSVENLEVLSIDCRFLFCL